MTSTATEHTKNGSWKNGSCPSCWREAIIVPLLKKGKPASEID